MPRIHKYFIVGLIISLFGINIATAQQIRVACLGNSITAGAKLSNPSLDSYPGVLGQLLGPEYLVGNFGYSTSTALKNSDSPYWDKQSYQYALGFFPDIVIIFFGTNDSKPDNWIYSDEFTSDYLALMESIKNKKPDANFILCFPPPFLNDPIHDNNLINEVIPMIAAIANQTRSVTLNIYDRFKGNDQLYVDGIHPNKEGHAIIANMLFNKLLAGFDVTPPGIPANLSAVGGDDHVYLSWDPNEEPDLASYLLFRGETIASAYNFLTIVQKPNVTYVDNSVIGSNSYYYSIAAMDQTGNRSGRSAIKLAIPIDTAPGTPTNFMAVSGDGHVNLSWDPNPEPDVASYLLFRGESGETSINYSTNVYWPNTMYFDNNLINGNSYYYSIAAMDKGGNMSDRSAVYLAIPKDNTIPEAPKNLGVITELGQVVLQWDNNLEPDLKEYDIYRSTETFHSNDEAARIGFVLTPETSFIDTVLDIFTEYFYSITAIDSSGNESGISNVVTTVTLDVNLEDVIQNINPELFLAPNPFNSKISITYNLITDTHVKISIFDMLGREVYSVVDKVQAAGWHSEVWNGKNSNGSPVSTGIYLYHFEANQKLIQGKIVHLK
jgi:fibronectin type 3 domain-containing protein/lysophospholipase L1-like esterase